MAVIFIILVNYFGNEVPLVVRTFQKIILKNFYKLQDSLSSQNIFVSQGYNYFSHTNELQDIAINQKSDSTVLRQKKKLRVTNQKIVKAYFRSRGGSRGRMQGVHTPPPSHEMTCGFLIQLVFCQKKTMWFIGVEVEQETSAPSPKKNPRSAPEIYLLLNTKPCY